MIRHSVMFKVAEGVDIKHMLELFAAIQLNVDKIKYWQVRVNDHSRGSGGDFWDVQLIADFATWTDFEHYSNDPFHLKMVSQLMPMLTHRAMCDYEFEDYNGVGSYGPVSLA